MSRALIRARSEEGLETSDIIRSVLRHQDVKRSLARRLISRIDMRASAKQNLDDVRDMEVISALRH